MSVEIRVPSLGESIVDAVIASWLKHEGDRVQSGDILVELETDKVNVDVTVDQSGVLQQILKQEGDTVSINEVIGLIADTAETQVAQVAPSPATQAASPSNKSAAAASAEPQPTRHAPPAAVSLPPQAAAAYPPDGQRPPSPLARRIAEEHNVDISQIAGHSPHGRVTKDDVIRYIEEQQAPNSPAEPARSAPPSPSRVAVPTQPPAQSTPAPSPALAPSILPDVSQGRREERVRLSRRRQTIAQRLVEAQHTAAMLTTFNEIDMSAVMEVRARRKEAFKERHNVSLGFMSFFTKAVVGALKAYPRLNSEIQGNDMLLKYYYDIGIAVGAEEGLVVPVLRDADRKNFAEIEREIASLAKKARENKLSLPELQGGTFTITNGGVFGSLLSTPILNGPQVGILGMHKIEQRPIALNGQVVIRPMMYVALSYDHRIVDGSGAVRFLVKVKELVEDPESLLLEG